jgi:hypothetical protein
MKSKASKWQHMLVWKPPIIIAMIFLKELMSNSWIIGICASIIAGLITSFLIYTVKKYLCYKKSNKIYSWICSNTHDKAGEQFKSTTEISEALQIDENQVRIICKNHKKIFEHARKKDLWGIYGSEPRSIYEERGVITI